MVAVRIPGADSIQNVAVARDPGVTATPDSFGAGIGESLSKLGNTAVEVGVLLDKKREAATAAMAIPEATAKFQLAAVTKRQESAKVTPESAASAGATIDTDLKKVQEEIETQTSAKYKLSDLHRARLNGDLTTIRGHTVIQGVTDGNNNIAVGLTASHNDTVKTIASNAMLTGDVDGALKQVDASVAALRGVVPENDLKAQSDASRKYVVDAMYGSLRAAGKYDDAQKLVTKFYGDVPSNLGDAGKSSMQHLQAALSLTKEQAAGGTGNLAHESGFNTSASGDNGTAFGIAQWRGERLDALKAFAASKNKPVTDYQTQLEFVGKELNSTEAAAFEKIKAAKTTKEAAAAWLAYERPKDWNTPNPHGWENRLRLAQIAAGEAVTAGGPPPIMPDPKKALTFHEDIAVAKAQQSKQQEASAEKARTALGEDYLKESYSRASKDSLTPDFIEAARPYISAAEYKGLQATQKGGADADDPRALIDLTQRLASETPDNFQKLATSYVEQGKLKNETYVSLSEKNRLAAKEDQPARPYRSGRDVVKTTLDPGQLLSGPAAAIARTSQAQALTEFDNWAQANPSATRADAVAAAQDTIRRYQIVPFEEMKLAIGTSKYFGSKTRQEIKPDDISAAEEKLFNDMEAGRLTKAQQEFEIRLLNNWRDITAKEAAAATSAKGAASGGTKR